jgi:hypothetical protein
MAPPISKTKPDGKFYYVSQTAGMYQVEFTEIASGYQESFIPGARTCTRVLECAWDNRLKFQLDLIGQHFQNGTEIARNLPEAHPDNPKMYCTGCQLVRGLGRDSIDFNTSLVRFLDGSANIPPAQEPDSPDNDSPTEPVYGRARFMTTWEALVYDLWTDDELGDIADQNAIGAGPEILRFTQKLETYATETISLPSSAFKWFNPPQDPLPQGLVKVFYTKEVTYRWFKVPKRPRLNVEACLGRVNKVNFEGFAPHTLLFLGPDMVIDPGTGLWDVNYKFLYRKVGWNRYFRPNATGGPAFEDFSHDGTLSTADGNKLIDEADFYTLWELDP